MNTSNWISYYKKERMENRVALTYALLALALFVVGAVVEKI